MGPWRIWVDTGGTFTDCLALDPEGRLHRAKVLSTSALRGRLRAQLSPLRLEIDAPWRVPAGFFRGAGFRLLGSAETLEITGFDAAAAILELAGPLAGGHAAPGSGFEITFDEEAPLLAARLVTGTPAGESLPPLELRLATTKGTNALLERKGARVAFFVTRGFGDLLEIGTQQRPELFALAVEKRRPLPAAVVEVEERLAADGSVLRELDLDALERAARELLALGIEVAAVALLHAFRNPEHERRVAARLRELGLRHVSASAELAPRIKLLPRAETAVVDAYLAPIVGGYLERVRGALGSGRLLAMTSAGGLVPAPSFHAKDSLLSGPAGGVVGSAWAARRSGFSKVIAFDMGGTSTDVSRFDGDFDYAFDHRVGDALLAAPALAIETVAAGGGSICRFDGQQLKVGPESAGASPGPAAYGAGGPLAVTDVNLLLGRLVPERFAIPLDPRAAQLAFEELARAAGGAEEELLAGLLEIADERMAEAIRQVSVARGYDPAGYALLAFGGAGGQHACAVAELLGIATVLVPPDAGLLSAAGLGAAVLERFAERQVLAPLAAVAAGLPALLDGLAAEAGRKLEAEAGESGGGVEIEVRRRIAHLRLVGQESALAVEVVSGEDLEAAFARAYREIYGYAPEGAVEVESVRVIVSTVAPVAEESPLECGDASPLSEVPGTSGTAPGRRQRAFLGGAWAEVPVLDREALPPGSRLAGPALVAESHGTTVVAPGWELEVDGAGALVLRHRLEEASTAPRRSRPEAVELELFTHRFEAVAREMGEMLRRTARSTNVKERLDFSCGLLDAAGKLVVNAPHIPVHLGALGLCVRRVRETLALAPGDVAVTNHPAWGGSHLPDVTVITPVFTAGKHPELLGHVASRAHHAEIGGITPGSMPPGARRLIEEGVVLPPSYLLRRGEPRWREIEIALAAPPYPSRAIVDNLADLAAAVAANHRGAAVLQRLAAEHGAETVRRMMRALADKAAERAEAALRRLGTLEARATELLDDGSPLTVQVTVEDGRARFDFTGSSPVHPGNLNAPLAVVKSAVLYVLRLLVAEPLPLNEALLRPVELVLPGGLLAPEFPADPAEAPAVVGGNVETSQRLVGLLLKALELAAGSQGTMNNLIFGNDRFGYYETVAGGCGAGPGFAGASAVHSHMTNTRITDPEILEHRYPVRLERFAVRRGSGGEGRWRGGDGVLRELTFLEPVTLSLLTQNRVRGPYGLAGGEPGAPGRQVLLHPDGTSEELAAIDGRQAAAGDRLVLETPGGGGWGMTDAAG
ncbi:MAG TPA: hydantoinase B/oxoprolinase family protein [Thermoanaerobaculia bacterium]|nr:hydantoinase B/oxoprolinase family protein [Thermoanaerobaculia bacterium]